MMYKKNRTLVLFDFDGTLTKKDSLIDFIKFSKGYLKLITGLILISPILFLYKLKVISNSYAKKKMIFFFFANYSEKKLLELGKNYSLNQIDKIIYKKAFKRIKWHQSQNHEIVIVSASIDLWLSPWCNKNKINLISTKLEVIEGKFSGNFSTKNCSGIEKVKRIKKKYNLEDYKLIYAYGNSIGDKEMLNLAHIRYYKHFKD